MRLFFVTPCFQRFELTDICLRQRLDAIEVLARGGVEATCVVVADDDNLDTARRLGMHVVERDNEWLGRRFNDGYQYAAEHGATHVFPIGSDSWVDPHFVLQAVERGTEKGLPLTDAHVVASRHYARVNTTGTLRRQLWVPVLQGVSYVLPVATIAHLGYRPCQDEISRGCDGSTWQRVSRGDVQVVWSEVHPLETTSFESWPQITQFDKLGGRWGVGDVAENVLDELHGYFPSDLVREVESFYAARRRGEVEHGEQLARDRERRMAEIVARVLADNKVPSSVRSVVRSCVQQAVREALA